MKTIIFVFLILINCYSAEIPSDLPVEVKNEMANIEETQSDTAAKANTGGETNAAAPLPKEETTSSAVTSVGEPVKTLNNEASTTKTSESEIPLNLTNDKKSAQTGSSSTQIFYILFLVMGFSVGGWILLKKYKNQNISRNKNEIKVLAQHYLGPKKSVAVIRVAGESILIGISDQNINLIKTLSLLDDELPDIKTPNFSQELNSQMGKSDTTDIVSNNKTYNRNSKIQKSSSQNSKDNTQSESEADEFSISGVKDLVSSKLKGMRSL